MRSLVHRLRVLRLRFHWLTTGLGVTARVADVLGLAWLVTILNILILTLLLLVLLLDVFVRALLRHATLAIRALCRVVLDVLDTVRQLLKLHLVLALLVLQPIENSNGIKSYMDVFTCCNWRLDYFYFNRIA